MKFFDMRMDFIQKDTRYGSSKGTGRDDLRMNEKNLILAPVLKSLAQGQ